MAKDSKLWEEAYKARRRVIKVPNYKKQKVKKKPFTPFVETMVLQQEYKEILEKIQVLTKRRQQIKRIMAANGQSPIKRKAYFDKPISLYALKLESGFYYIGMTRDTKKRLARHTKGKGSMWTKLYKPIEYVEIRETGLNDDSKVGLMEDDMTLEYALKFGSDKVRGGGYCQRKPRWPDVITQNEILKQ